MRIEKYYGKSEYGSTNSNYGFADCGGGFGERFGIFLFVVATSRDYVPDKNKHLQSLRF